MNEWLSNASAILSFIVLLGSAITALCMIFGKFFGPLKKRREKIRQQQEEAERKRIDEELKKELPAILLAHDLETKEKYKADRDKYLHEIKEEVIDSIEDDLDAIHQLQKDVSIMADSARDVLREKIMVIYHKGKRTKSMPLHHREALKQYYTDYKAMNGNSYIDKYYSRMETWTTLDDDYDDD